MKSIQITLRRTVGNGKLLHVVLEKLPSAHQRVVGLDVADHHQKRGMISRTTSKKTAGPLRNLFVVAGIAGIPVSSNFRGIPRLSRGFVETSAPQGLGNEVETVAVEPLLETVQLVAAFGKVHAAAESGFVTCLSHTVDERGNLRGKNGWVAVDTHVAGILPRQETHPGRHAQGGGTVQAGEANSRFRDFINVGCHDDGIAFAPQDVRIVLVRHDQQDVGPVISAQCIPPLLFSG